MVDAVNEVMVEVGQHTTEDGLNPFRAQIQIECGEYPGILRRML